VDTAPPVRKKDARPYRRSAAPRRADEQVDFTEVLIDDVVGCRTVKEQLPPDATKSAYLLSSYFRQLAATSNYSVIKLAEKNIFFSTGNTQHGLFDGNKKKGLLFSEEKSLLFGGEIPLPCRTAGRVQPSRSTAARLLCQASFALLSSPKGKIAGKRQALQWPLAFKYLS